MEQLCEQEEEAQEEAHRQDAQLWEEQVEEAQHQLHQAPRLKN